MGFTKPLLGHFSSRVQLSEFNKEMIAEDVYRQALRLRIEHLTLCVPFSRPGRCIFSNVSFSLEDGDSLLISGNGGLGKSSLMRAIAGLWGAGSGSIERAAMHQCFFLPQRPYM